jgi:hypothetical protein
MGAENVEFILPMKGTESQIEKAFKEAQDDGLHEYGHNPYNGTFSTIDRVKITDLVFDDFTKAHEYCLDNAEKWEYALAVFFKTGIGQIHTLVAGWAAC